MYVLLHMYLHRAYISLYISRSLYIYIYLYIYLSLYIYIYISLYIYECIARFP